MNAISNVWCVITPPDFDGTSVLPTYELAWDAASGRYELPYNGFLKAGTYELTFYAQDTLGELSDPAQSEVLLALREGAVVGFPHAGLVDIALSAIEHRNERRQHRGPQCQDDRELEQLHPVGENQRRTRPDGQHQQRRQQQPTRPAAAAPGPGSAGRNGHGPTVPARGHRACRPTPAILRSVYRPASSPDPVVSPGDLQQCCSHRAATTSASALPAATTAPGASSPATRSVACRGSR